MKYSEQFRNNFKINITFDIIDKISDIENIRNIWEDLYNIGDEDLDFYKIIVNRKEVIKPYILVVYINNKPMQLILGRIEKIKEQFSIGYKTILKKNVKRMIIHYQGILGTVTDEISTYIIRELLLLLRNKEVDIIQFNYICIENCLYRAILKMSSIYKKNLIIKKSVHWRITLPNNYSEYFNKRKNKKHLKNIYRKLLNDFSNNIEFKVFRKEDEVKKLCSDIENISRKTYLRGLKKGFYYNEENYNRIMLNANKNRLLAIVLYIRKKPCAFFVGTIFNNLYVPSFTGYDQKYRKYEIGTITLIKLIEKLCKEKIKYFDFGIGDALYKQRFADLCWEDALVQIYGRTIKSQNLKAINITINFFNTSIKEILEKMNLTNKIKKYYRMSSFYNNQKKSFKEEK